MLVNQFGKKKKEEKKNASQPQHVLSYLVGWGCEQLQLPLYYFVGTLIVTLGSSRVLLMQRILDIPRATTLNFPLLSPFVATTL